MSGCRLILFSFGRVCRWRCCDLTAVLAVAGVNLNTSFAIPTKGERLVDFETMWLAEPQPSSHDPGLGYRAQCATLLLTHWISDTSSKWRRLTHPADELTSILTIMDVLGVRTNSHEKDCRTEGLISPAMAYHHIPCH